MTPLTFLRAGGCSAQLSRLTRLMRPFDPIKWPGQLVNLALIKDNISAFGGSIPGEYHHDPRITCYLCSDIVGNANNTQ